MHVPYISTSVGTSKQPRLAAQECGKGSLYQYFKGCSLAFKRPGSGTEWSLGVILPVNIFFWIFSFSERAPENSGAKFRYFWRHILAPKFKTIHCFGVSKTLMIDMHATLFEFKSWCRLYFCCYYWVSAVAQHSTVFESCWFWRTENIAFWHKIIHFCRNSNLQKAAANVFQQRRFRISRVSSDRGTVAVVQAELFHSMRFRSKLLEFFSPFKSIQSYRVVTLELMIVLWPLFALLPKKSKHISCARIIIRNLLIFQCIN